MSVKQAASYDGVGENGIPCLSQKVKEPKHGKMDNNMDIYPHTQMSIEENGTKYWSPLWLPPRTNTHSTRLASVAKTLLSSAEASYPGPKLDIGKRFKNSI